MEKEVKGEMMKISKKYGIVALVLIGVLCAGIAYAAFTVYSTPVGVTVNYTITVSTSGYPTLQATVTNGGSPVNGATVYFYYYQTTIGGAAPSTPSGTPPPAGWTYWDVKTTDGSGHASTTFDPPNNLADYYFTAYYTVP